MQAHGWVCMRASVRLTALRQGNFPIVAITLHLEDVAQHLNKSRPSNTERTERTERSDTERPRTRSAPSAAKARTCSGMLIIWRQRLEARRRRPMSTTSAGRISLMSTCNLAAAPSYAWKMDLKMRTAFAALICGFAHSSSSTSTCHASASAFAASSWVGNNPNWVFFC